MIKEFVTGKSTCRVTLERQGGFWVVKVDGNIYYKGVNELFAVQKFLEV